MIKRVMRKMAGLLKDSIQPFALVNHEKQLLAIGSGLCWQQQLINSEKINDYEFRIFSQFGDDGIIQYLIKNVAIKNELFIEFGVEDYLESNTRFLMMNNNWSGFVMDASEELMTSLQNQSWYWRYQLTHKTAFIDKENINGLLADTGFADIGVLSIDLDGNDYHILNEMDLSKLNPSILIIEYNSVFGKDRSIGVPYNKGFIRSKAHYSNLYWGASLAAVNYAAAKKGYSFVACNLAGNNAYFIQRSLLNEKVKEVPVAQGFKESKFRESRNKDYSFSYLAGKDRLEMIKGMDVINVLTNEKEKL